MTSEEAAIADILSALPFVDSNGGFVNYISPQTIETALSALREKQEREKGCEYCNDPDTEYGAISFPRTETGGVDINKVEAVEACFCPNCGRELKPKEAANG